VVATPAACIGRGCGRRKPEDNFVLDLAVALRAAAGLDVVVEVGDGFGWAGHVATSVV
jgi:hypothetical protein